MKFKGAILRPVLKWSSLLVVLTSLVFAFQNCGKAGFDDMGEEDLSSSDVDPKLANLPFPYDISINQLVYMSCPNPRMLSGSPESLFTFHVGAYDNTGTVANSKPLSRAGLGLNNQYKTAFTTAMSFYNSQLHTAKLKEALMTVPNAVSVQPQLSFRETQSAQTRMTRWLNFDYDATSVLMLDPLSSERYADKISLNPTQQFSFFNTAATLNKGTVSAYLALPAPISVQDEYIYRSLFNSNRLSLAFVDAKQVNSLNSGGLPAASPGPENSFYGRGYQITFEGPYNGPGELTTNHTLYPSRTIESITEYDGTNPNIATTARWSCDYKFKIVKPEDRMKPLWRIAQDGQGYAYSCDPAITTAQERANNWYCACPPESYEELNTPEKMAAYHMLRRALPAEAWDINTTKRCVVPKQAFNLCYQAYPTNVPISYDEYFFPEAGRDATANPPRYGECDTEGQPACAHYVTLCHKSN